MAFIRHRLVKILAPLSEMILEQSVAPNKLFFRFSSPRQEEFSLTHIYYASFITVGNTQKTLFSAPLLGFNFITIMYVSCCQLGENSFQLTIQKEFKLVI
jgi:hypothetical protein